MERAVQGGRGHPDDVRRTLVGDDTEVGRQCLGDRDNIAGHAHRQLRAVALGIGGRDDRDARGGRDRLQQAAQVGVQAQRPRAQGRHSDLVEQPQRRDHRGHRQHRGVRQRPRIRRCRRIGHRVHREASVGVGAPPALQAGKRAVAHVPFVHEQRRDRPGSGVQVLVGAPRREVDVPVVQGKRDVAGRMGEVPAHRGTDSVAGRGDGGHVHHLSGQVVHPAEHHRGDRVRVVVEHRDDVFGAQGVLAGPRGQAQDGGVGVVAAEGHVRAHGVGVRGERAVLDDDAVADVRGSVERRQQQVQVDGEGVGGEHLARMRADESGHAVAGERVIVQPRLGSLGVAAHRQCRPVVEFGEHGVAGGARLQPQGVASHVGRQREVAAGSRGDEKRVAPVGRVRGAVQQEGVVLGGVDGHWFIQYPHPRGCGRVRRAPSARRCSAGR